MSPERSSLERKKRKISRKSVDDDVEICDVQNVIRNIPCGIIKKVILKNVFCHGHLLLDEFTPELNLIQGANGSGKSSVVAAIIVGLGGSCRATDRSQNIKNLIKNGEYTASIEIHLSNDGYNSYQKDKFGNTIIVERKMTSGGSSNYKIKSEQGACISSKREDLCRILEKFNIQVDNPALILSQERAKTFLSSTNPNNLFKFFVTSTQLKQWNDSISDIKKDLHTQKILISHRKESMKFLERDLAETRKKVKAMTSLEENCKRVEKLHREKEWAEVKEYEDEKMNLQEQLSEIEIQSMKLREKITDFSRELNELKSQRKANDDRVVTLSEQTESLDRERIEAKKKYEEAKKLLQNKKYEMSDLKTKKLRRENDVEILRQKLDDDSNEAKVNWEMEMRQLKEENENLKENLQKCRGLYETEEIHLQNINKSLSKAKEELDYAKVQKMAHFNKLKDLKNEYNSIKIQKDNVTVFGSYMPGILQEIKRFGNTFQHMPIGPLGNFIKVKDTHKMWIYIVEKVLSNVLSAFLVFSKNDFYQLKKIFDKMIPQNSRQPRIIISSFREEMHDVRRFETHTRDFFSMWSIIETNNNIQVANALLDQCQVESILLIPEVENALNLLSEQKNVPVNCLKAMTLKGDTIFPDPNYRLYSGGKEEKRARFLQASVEDRIRDLLANIHSNEINVKKCQDDERGKNIDYERLNKEKSTSERKIATYKNEEHNYLMQIHELKNREVPPPPNVSQLQNELQENLNKIQDLEKSLSEIYNSINLTTKEVNEASKRHEEIQKSCEDIRTDVENYKRDKNQTEQKLHQRQKKISACEEFVKKISRQIKEIEASIETKNQIIDKKVNDLEKTGVQRITVDRSKEEIEKELNNLESAIKRQQSTFGDMDVLVETLHKKSENLTQLKNELKSQEKYIEEMEKSVNERLSSLYNAKKMYKSIMSHTFKQYITKRKLKGRMEIDYKNETLKIMTTKDTGSDSQKLQSLAMMSGGERSFTTVSFVLALWDIVISPIRIMDEFDVFMDIVSRKQCIDMITESVKESAQYIMVTPLECQVNPDKVKIIPLAPPERNSVGGRQESEDE